MRKRLEESPARSSGHQRFPRKANAIDEFIMWLYHDNSNILINVVCSSLVASVVPIIVFVFQVKGPVRVGRSFEIEVRFTNPLKTKLERAEFTFEGPGLSKRRIVKIRYAFIYRYLCRYYLLVSCHMSSLF